jgi:hypothetical protein
VTEHLRSGTSYVPKTDTKLNVSCRHASAKTIARRAVATRETRENVTTIAGPWTSCLDTVTSAGRRACGRSAALHTALFRSRLGQVEHRVRFKSRGFAAVCVGLLAFAALFVNLGS